MNDIRTIHSVEHEGFFYVVTNDGFFAKGCRRCGGTGHYLFNGLDSICYLCRNVWEARLGDVFDSEESAKKWCHERAVRRAQADRKREALRLEKLAKRQAAWDQLAAEHPAVWELVSKAADIASLSENRESHITERDTFVLSLADKLWNFDERQYTDRQIAALQAVADKRVAAAADAVPAPAGRVEVSGEIVSAKVKSSDFGDAYKLVVKDDRGFRVYVSLPKAQMEQAYNEFLAQVTANGQSIYDFGPWCFFMGTDDGQYAGVKGRRITFTATLEPSADDESFAFGSRPTKGAWL